MKTNNKRIRKLEFAYVDLVTPVIAKKSSLEINFGVEFRKKITSYGYYDDDIHVYGIEIILSAENPA